MKSQYKKFHNAKQVNEWYSTYSSFFPSDKDDDTDFLKTIEFYTGNANTPINRVLRNNGNFQYSEFLYNIYQKMRAKLSSYQIPDNVVVYRYISKNILNYMCSCSSPKKGMIMHDDGFMSTTLLLDSIRDFVRPRPELNVLLEISIPKGTNGIYVGHLDCTEEEYEIILAPNTQLRIDYKTPFVNNYFRCTVVI